MGKNRIKGFSLQDIIVSLLISTMVIVSTFSFYEIFYKSTIEFNKRLRYNLEFINMISFIQNDFENCDYLYRTDSSLLFYFKTELRKYVISDSLLLMVNPYRMDSLRIGNDKFQTYFESKAIEYGYVDEIVFLTSSLNNNESDFYMQKKYDAYNLLQFTQTQQFQ